MKGSENSGQRNSAKKTGSEKQRNSAKKRAAKGSGIQRKKQAAEFSEGKGQRKAAKFSEKTGQRKTAKFSEKTGSEKQRNSAKKKNGQRKAAEFSEKKQAAEFLKIPTRTTIICVVPHLRPTHRCRVGCRAHLTAGKSVEIMRTDYTVLSVYCGKRSYMNEHEPIKNQT